MKKKKKSIEMRLWRLETLASQIEVLGLILRYQNAEISFSDQDCAALGSLLEDIGGRIQTLKRSLMKDLYNMESPIRAAILEEEGKWQ